MSLSLIGEYDKLGCFCCVDDDLGLHSVATDVKFIFVEEEKDGVE